MAAKNYYVDLDLNKQKLVNFAIESLASEPAVGDSFAGRMYLNSVTNKIGVYGTTWEAVATEDYVTSAISSAGLSSGSGITVNTGNIDLGGTLSADADVVLDGHSFLIDADGSTPIFTATAAQVTVNQTSRFLVDYTAVDLSSTGETNLGASASSASASNVYYLYGAGIFATYTGTGQISFLTGINVSATLGADSTVPQGGVLAGISAKAIATGNSDWTMGVRAQANIGSSSVSDEVAALVAEIKLPTGATAGDVHGLYINAMEYGGTAAISAAVLLEPDWANLDTPWGLYFKPAVKNFLNGQLGLGTNTGLNEMLTVNGAITIGAATTTTAGTLQYASNTLSYYNGTAWKSLATSTLQEILDVNSTATSLISVTSPTTTNNAGFKVFDDIGYYKVEMFGNDTGASTSASINIRGGNANMTATGTGSGITLSGVGGSFVITDTLLKITDSRAGAAQTGLVYNADYSVNYTARSLVDKAYVDSVAQGLVPHIDARVATTANLAVNASGSGVGKTLTATSNGAISIDSVALSLNDRVLVKNQTTAVDNGVYEVTTVGDGSNPFVLTRATDFDGSPSTEVRAGSFLYVREGTDNTSSSWVVLAVAGAEPTVDTDPLNWAQLSGALEALTEGAGIDITTGVISVDYNAVTAALTTGASYLEDNTGTIDVNLTNMANGLVSTSSYITATTGIIDVDYDTLFTDIVGDGLSWDSVSLSLDFTTIVGTGLVESGSEISVENYTPVTGTTVSRKQVFTGESLTGSDVITHDLNTTAVKVAVYDESTDDEVVVDINATSASTITIGTSVSFTATIVIFG